MKYTVVPIWLIQPNAARPFVIALSSVQANIVSCFYFGEMRNTNEGSIFFFSQVDGSHGYLTSKMSQQPITLKYRPSVLSLTKCQRLKCIMPVGGQNLLNYALAYCGKYFMSTLIPCICPILFEQQKLCALRHFFRNLLPLRRHLSNFI